jgi:hypothetical protein
MPPEESDPDANAEVGKWALRDSNPRPSDYESAALTI